MKKCVRCNGILDDALFCKSKQNKDGLMSYCKACNRARVKEYREKYPDKLKEWKMNNKDKVKRHKANDYAKRKEHIDAKNKKWAKDNRVRSREIKKKYRENNVHILTEIAARRRTCKHSAIAIKYKKELIEIYKNRPVGYHVDHIVPLVHNKVSGLHVPWNLQYLTISENHRKSNKFVT